MNSHFAGCESGCAVTRALGEAREADPYISALRTRLLLATAKSWQIRETGSLLEGFDVSRLIQDESGRGRVREGTDEVPFADRHRAQTEASCGDVHKSLSS